MNPLFKEFGGQSYENPLLKQFINFKQNFKGDAKSQVEQLLKSGRVTQQQYDQAVAMANQFQQLFK